MTKEELVLEAINAQKLSYSPYSKFKVGAALLTKSGKVYLGANIENASYGLTICAERNAIYNAYCNGVNFDEIVALAIVAQGESPVSPCGACRQVMNELLPKNTKIFLANLNNDIIETTVNELLPYSFNNECLDIWKVDL